MKYWEIEFKTPIRNADSEDGYWYNYYDADSKEDATKMFETETKRFRIHVTEVVNVTEVEVQ